jgi:aspartyl-tRNA(Asn)/glutamyl-tRNA(Gln) amidotransferase subunit A
VVSALVELSIAEANRLLLTKAVSSVELTLAAVEQIERTEPSLHAYATLMVDQALEDARRADQEIASSVSRGQLHGIPVGVKDLCCTRGVPTEAGSEAMKGYTPAFDATVVSRLRAAGAVILGKTVTSEFAFGPTLAPTRNAWNQSFSASGSSAGSAVAVAARSAFGAIGTDTGGSIRAPAGANGVVGLKPTFGLVSKWGVIPMSPSLDHVGPIARTVTDCALLLAAIAGFDPLDPYSLARETADFKPRDEAGVVGRRIGIERCHLPDPLLDPIAMAALDEAAAALDALGATLVELEIPALEIVDATMATITSVDASAYHIDRLKRDAGKYAQATRIVVEAGAMIPGTHYVRAQRCRSLLRRSLWEAFEVHRLDALIAPGWGPPGPATQDYDPFRFPSRPGMVNLTGMPAINLPCGFTSGGLPLGGFELYGRPLGEATLLRIARAYERAHPWNLAGQPLLARPGYLAAADPPSD